MTVPGTAIENGKQPADLLEAILLPQKVVLFKTEAYMGSKTPEAKLIR